MGRIIIISLGGHTHTHTHTHNVCEVELRKPKKKCIAVMTRMIPTKEAL